MKPQDSFQNTLQQHRNAIDAIDTQIIALLKERCGVVQQVGHLKEAHKVAGSFIRPGREAIMLRAILESTTGQALPAQAIAAIWRIIMHPNSRHMHIR